MKTLYLIPARGGSKGIPGKNIKPFLGKPLICHAIDQAREAGADDADICVSTDSEEIRKTVEDYGLKVPFMRPKSLMRAHNTPNGMDTTTINASEIAARDKVIGSLSPISSATGIISFIFLA